MSSKWEFGKREKTLVIVLIILLVALFIKSSYFDVYEAKNTSEEEAISEIEKLFPSSFLIDKRVVKIKEIDMQGEEIRYGYNVTLRYYLFHFIPIRDKIIRM